MLIRLGITKASRGGRGALLGVLLLSATACQDLQVENLVEADRERATGNPGDVEAFISGAFHPPMWQALHVISQNWSLWPQAGPEFTATFSTAGDTQLRYEEIKEPRIAHNNAPTLSLGNGPHGPRNTWTQVLRANTIAYDGLQLIATGMLMCEPTVAPRGATACAAGSVDRTPRAKAFSKLIQGWSWGVMGLVFDETHIVPETVDIPGDPDQLYELTLNSLVPSDSVIRAAIRALEEAILIAQQNPTVVNYPSFAESPFWFGSTTAITNAQFIQIANTLAARTLIISARTPEERRALDWTKILAFTNAGISTASNNLVKLLSTASGRPSDFLLNIQTNQTTTFWNTRWDYRTIGMADQSGAYQTWSAASLDARDRFDIVTPDRRITGATPTSNGTYTAYRADNNGFIAERGEYNFSAYQWARRWMEAGVSGAGNTVGHNTGGWGIVTADENTLYKAEALLRTGNAQGAADAINVTRTRVRQGVSLPAVTTAGAPTVSGECVPRTDAGVCGSLYDALRYERMIELAGIDVFRGYMDARGFGMLPNGSLLEWPVPGNALDLYGLESYSYGGVGQPNTATYAPQSAP